MKGRTSQVRFGKGNRYGRGQRLRLEQLERRDLMTASPFEPEYIADGIPVLSSSGRTTPAAGPTTANFPLSSIPVLNSNPSAAVTIVLDFDGNFLPEWFEFTDVVTPVYDVDGDRTSFSAQELQNIRDIWASVSEDYAPFNVNVTTVDTDILPDGVAIKIAIGGAYTDWFGSASGGVAPISGFTMPDRPNVGFVFPTNLQDDPHVVAEATSHEAGHLFGLLHHSLWQGATKLLEYDPGTPRWAPIMGNSYDSTVTTWSNGRSSAGPSSFQDDLAILSGAVNGFGYRTNLIGNSASAKSLGNSGVVSESGIIARNNDQNWYEFSTDGGNVSLTVTNAEINPNLDSVLEIRDLNGNVVFSANSPFSLDSTLNVWMNPGTYFAVVRSTGVYGYVGQYTLTGAFPPKTTTTAPPEITVTQGGADVPDGGSISFGTTAIGAFVDRTFTISNDGGAPLVLQALDTNLPAEFAIIANLGKTTLEAGDSTTFTIRMTAVAAGTFSGVIHIGNNDTDEAVFDINVSGTVNAPVAPLTLATIDNGDSGYTSGGAWATNVGAGRANDFSFVQPTAASSYARWTAVNLAPGTYRIATSYPNFAKAASNARFYFGDDVATLGSKLINQRLKPASFTADGSQWQTIATVTITAGHSQLWVQTNNKGVDGFVVADAIRFERISAPSPILPAKSAPAAAATSSSAMLAQVLADEAFAQSGRKR